jgi:hypothetical protein
MTVSFDPGSSRLQGRYWKRSQSPGRGRTYSACGDCAGLGRPCWRARRFRRPAGLSSAGLALYCMIAGNRYHLGADRHQIDRRAAPEGVRYIHLYQIRADAGIHAAGVRRDIAVEEQEVGSWRSTERGILDHALVFRSPSTSWQETGMLWDRNASGPVGHRPR